MVCELRPGVRRFAPKCWEPSSGNRISVRSPSSGTGDAYPPPPKAHGGGGRRNVGRHFHVARPDDTPERQTRSVTIALALSVGGGGGERW